MLKEDISWLEKKKNEACYQLENFAPAFRDVICVEAGSSNGEVSGGSWKNQANSQVKMPSLSQFQALG